MLLAAKLERLIARDHKEVRFYLRSTFGVVGVGIGTVVGAVLFPDLLPTDAGEYLDYLGWFVTVCGLVPLKQYRDRRDRLEALRDIQESWREQMEFSEPDPSDLTRLEDLILRIFEKRATTHS